jgi:hypothetical protein
MEGMKVNLENRLGVIFFIDEQSKLSILVSWIQKIEQLFSSILALTAFFLSSLFNPLMFQWSTIQFLLLGLCEAIDDVSQVIWDPFCNIPEE